MSLEELKRGMLVEGVSPDGVVTLKNVESDGTVEVILKDDSGRIGERLLSRSDEANLNVVRGTAGGNSTVTGPGSGWRPRRAGSAQLTSSALGSLYTRLSLIPIRTRSLPSARGC